jgi:hypothetical protein
MICLDLRSAIINLQFLRLLFHLLQEFLHVRLAPLGGEVAGEGAVKERLARETR